MSTFKVDFQYIGTVIGAQWIVASTGTQGLELLLRCDDGEISYTIWVSEKSLDIARRQFQALGLTDDQVADENYMFGGAPVDVLGTQVSFRVKEETFNDKPRLKVSGINPVMRQEQAKAKFGSLFGKNKVTITNGDIPF